MSLLRDRPIRFQQLLCAPLAHLSVRQQYSRKGRGEVLADFLIIVAHDSDVCANAYPAFPERFVASNCHKVVRAENRIWMQRGIQ